MKPLPFFLILAIFAIASPPCPANDYQISDENGQEIKLPPSVIIYTQTHPGGWKKEATLHAPKIKSHIRYSGLEQIRIVTIEIPHPMQDETLGAIQKIYILDKDALIIGYREFHAWDKKATFLVKLNGVINYIKVFITCSKHGDWLSEIRF
ncbi:MAG: hypothetical protein EXS63_03265 [Candidatus Omnitrophica bacterium]|nr:hypothetical protein [Candidatus Omnitrophota bacterium]